MFRYERTGNTFQSCWPHQLHRMMDPPEMLNYLWNWNRYNWDPIRADIVTMANALRMTQRNNERLMQPTRNNR